VNRTPIPRALALAVAAAAVAFVPASLGAGGGTTLTKAQVIARGSAICKAGERKVDALPQLHSQHPLTKDIPRGERHGAIVFLAGYGDALQGVGDGLAKLKVPAEGRALFEGFLAELRPTVATFRAAHRDAVAGRYTRAEAEAQRAFELFAKASKKTAAYGFPKGVCQSG
jgi:hypothetical protein